MNLQERLTYSPQVGWTVSYPFDGGSQQNDVQNRCRLRAGSNDWVVIHQFEDARDDAEMLSRLALETPNNKIGVVVSASDDLVVVSYHHDLFLQLIAYSQRNLRRLFGAAMMKDALHNGLEIWSWMDAKSANSVAVCAAQMLELDENAAAIAANTHQRFHGPASASRVFVPQLTLDGRTGWLIMNCVGEPVGIRIGEEVVAVKRDWQFDRQSTFDKLGLTHSVSA